MSSEQTLSCTDFCNCDDTFAIVTEGLVAQTKLKVLTAGIGSTYKSERFADSPIDSILVGGPLAQSTFSAAKLQDPSSDKPFGSDHFLS
jgi:hypothetical protein